MRDERREGLVLWTSEQKINTAIILSCECFAMTIGAGKGEIGTNHGVVCVSKKGPTASVDFLDDERVWNKPRFLF